MISLQKLRVAIPTIYRYGSADATPYMRRVVAMMVMYPVLWIAISFSRFAKEGWSGIHFNYLLGGEVFLLGGFLILHIYVVTRFGWRRFVSLLSE